MPIATTSNRSDRQIVFALEAKSTQIFENIFKNNGALAALGSSGTLKMVKGSNEFDERVHLGQNPNGGHGTRFGQIDTNVSDAWKTAKYGQALWRTAVVVSMIEDQQAAGTYKLDDIAIQSIKEAERTASNDIGSAIMAVTPGANDPESIVNTIEATEFGSQTSTTGGLSRSTYPSLPGAWQNQYSSTAMDLSGSAGIATATNFLLKCSQGGGNLDQKPNFGFVSIGTFAKASGGGDNLRRYVTDDKMIKFGFENIKLDTATLLTDANLNSTNGTNAYMYLINTNYVRMQVVSHPDSKVVGEVKTIGGGMQRIPINVSKPIESSDFLTWVTKLWMLYNITFGGLKQHGVATNMTEASS